MYDMEAANPRLIAFRALARHPWLGRGFAKLTKGELAMAEAFLEGSASLDVGACELAINRLFLDKPKPKNWAIICELLCAANKAA